MYFVAIEGNIGAGKTSLAKQIASQTNSKLILEEFEDNPYLPLFYKKPKNYAFQLELFFLVVRYEQLNKELNNSKDFNTFIISDYFIEKSLLFASINLSEQDFLLFKKIYDSVIKQISKPDLLVYLNLEIEQLKKHINSRNRSYEQLIKDDYLLNIEQAYINYLKKNTELKSIILDCKQREWLKFDQYSDRIMDIINTNLKNDFRGNKRITL